MDIAVLFLTYRRYDTAEKVFESIRAAEPRRLYFASNAPNPQNGLSEKIDVNRVRSLAEKIDWPCELFTLFREEHLTVIESIPSSIDWFFEHEDEGVILEDDCLPSNSFFIFCKTLLDFHRYDDHVRMISGNNFQGSKDFHGLSSYYYSRYFHIWGWATWKRAWVKYRENHDQIKNKQNLDNLKIPFKDIGVRFYWARILRLVERGKLRTWDHIWTFTCWIDGGISCIPDRNLVSNIGFGEGATFTFDKSDRSSALQSYEIVEGVSKNMDYRINEDADQFTSKYHYNISTYKEIIKRMIRYE